jgi:hypothetical protein
MNKACTENLPEVAINVQRVKQFLGNCERNFTITLYVCEQNNFNDIKKKYFS